MSDSREANNAGPASGATNGQDSESRSQVDVLMGSERQSDQQSNETESSVFSYPEFGSELRNELLAREDPKATKLRRDKNGNGIDVDNFDMRVIWYVNRYDLSAACEASSRLSIANQMLLKSRNSSSKSQNSRSIRYNEST